MVKKQEIIEELKEPIITPPSNREIMIKQRDEYLTLLQRLKDEGIVNIGILENKISRLSQDIG